jgi:hypothetical protein
MWVITDKFTLFFFAITVYTVLTCLYIILAEVSSAGLVCSANMLKRTAHAC